MIKKFFGKDAQYLKQLFNLKHSGDTQISSVLMTASLRGSEGHAIIDIEV